MGIVTIPIMPSGDLDMTVHFYTALGFDELARAPDEYLIMCRSDGMELHFWYKRDHDPLVNDVACYVRLDTATEAQRLHDGWARAGPRGGQLHRPVPTRYGMLEFALVDPHGNLLRIGGTLPS